MNSALKSNMPELSNCPTSHTWSLTFAQVLLLAISATGCCSFSSNAEQDVRRAEALRQSQPAVYELERRQAMHEHSLPSYNSVRWSQNFY
jgi:hypothetical protein